MTRVLIAVVALAAGIESAQAATYHRFWRGTKLATLSAGEFIQGLNQVFIPATVQTGAGKRMIAYEPILTAGIENLPDEVALVSYENKATYDSLYATDAGKAYQNLHWQYFDRSSSHSLTPCPYIGKVEIEQAYDLHPEYADWRKNQTTVAVFLRRSDESDPAYLVRVAEHLNADLIRDPKDGVLDRTILVAQSYWLEYVSGESAITAEPTANYLLSVKSEVPSAAQIIVGGGVNLQF